MPTKKWGRGRSFVLLTAVLLLSSACTSPTTSNSSASPTSAATAAATKAPAESAATNKTPIKIGVLASMTGALESYGKQTTRGFEMGIDYVTKGTKVLDGHPIQIVVEDTETKPDVAIQKATKLLEKDKVDFLVGSSSSGDTLAVLPLAQEYKKVMIVEPAVADSITGASWNRYIFRTGRNSSQDAVAGAAAIAKQGVKIATLRTGQRVR